MFYKTLLVMIICIVCPIPLNVYSSSIKEDYELQERCGKRVEELFHKRYGNPGIRMETKDGFQVYEYLNHYNRRLNKCFYIKKNDICNKEGLVLLTIMELFDINENRKYGSIYHFKDDTGISKRIDCSVTGTICKSEGEWNLLLKPYMED